MRNTLGDLNNYLFEQLERLNDDELTEDELEREINKSETVIKVADMIVKNGELALKVWKHGSEQGVNQTLKLPTLFEVK
ncbi:MAG: hypothetical protein GYA87_01980 [Christensenellaceae bacterium]|nr:hypothetical protein [Christensenellaceae bacterium]